MYAQTQISKPSESLSPTSRIKMQLTQAAMMRGAKLDPETIKLYSARLVREPFEDVIAALEKIGEMRREQYETALPDLGTVLEMVRIEGVARCNRASAAQNVELIVWKCRTCRGTTNNYFPIAQNMAAEILYCRRQAQRQGARSGEICGGNLDVIHREVGDAA